MISFIGVSIKIVQNPKECVIFIFINNPQFNETNISIKHSFLYGYILDTFKSGNIAIREPTKVSFFSSLNDLSKKVTFEEILKNFRRGQALMAPHVAFASKSLDCDTFL